MADICDTADDHAQPLIDAALKDAHLRALADNVPFIKGDCECCEEHFDRLVRCVHPLDGDVWACGRCRDKQKLKLKGR